MKSRFATLLDSRLTRRVLPIIGVVIAVGAAEVQREELKTGVTFDAGQIQQGVLENGPFKDQMLQRTGVSMTQSVNIEDRLNVTVGIGGLFYYSLEETRDFWKRLIKFGPGIGQAQLQVKLGNTQAPWGKLQIGLVPYKYNPDAKNLGEYLMRCNAYPNVLVTGGWSVINSAGILLRGLNFEAKTGPLRHNLLVSMEWGQGPQNDITPAYLVAYNPVQAVELGAGVAFAYLIPIKPSLTTPDYSGQVFEATQKPLGRYKADSVVTDPNDSVYTNYTNQAIKLMARASFNPQILIKSGMLGPEDLKVYAEAAVLGWKNYPYYYEDRMRRVPIMVGFNFPTFKLLDRLSLELEFRDPEFLNSSRISYEVDGLPLPYIPRPSTIVTYDSTLLAYKSGSRPAWDSLGRTVQQDSLMKDQGFKWSIYAKRTVVPGLTLYCQAASDHMRGIHFKGFPLSETIGRSWKDWYFLFRVELGI